MRKLLALLAFLGCAVLVTAATPSARGAVAADRPLSSLAGTAEIVAPRPTEVPSPIGTTPDSNAGESDATSDADPEPGPEPIVPESVPIAIDTRAATVGASPACPSSEALGLLASINAVRADMGVAPLAFSDALCGVAQDLSDDLARTGRLSHTNSRGQTFAERLHSGGVRFGAAAENLGRAGSGDGNATLTAVLRGFLSSEPHRTNTLDPVFAHVGIGVASEDTTTVYTVTFTD